VDIGKHILEDLGYAVVGTTTGNEALQAFKAQPDKFDLVITDMTMPGMTVDVLTQELLNLRPELPIILTTGFSEKMTKEGARAIGVRAFVMKPIVKRDLARTIREVLDGRFGP